MILCTFTIILYTYIIMQVEVDLPPDIMEWEISHDDLIIQCQLGSGQFGRVFSAILSTSTRSQRAQKYINCMRLMEGCRLPQLVAVKQLKGERINLVAFMRIYATEFA